MGAKDRKANEYFADNRRFADMCNAVLFGGRTVILPEALEATDCPYDAVLANTDLATAISAFLNVVSSIESLFLLSTVMPSFLRSAEFCFVLLTTLEAVLNTELSSESPTASISEL